MVSRPRSRAQSSVSVYRRAEDGRSETHRPADSHSLPLAHIHTEATLLRGLRIYDKVEFLAKSDEQLHPQKKRYKTNFKCVDYNLLLIFFVVKITVFCVLYW